MTDRKKNGLTTLETNEPKPVIDPSNFSNIERPSLERPRLESRGTVSSPGFPTRDALWGKLRELE